MGYGLPAAVGAGLAADDNQSVVCFDGDGSFLMTMQVLAVAVREGLDITVVVLNNAAVGMVRQWQDASLRASVPGASALRSSSLSDGCGARPRPRVTPHSVRRRDEEIGPDRAT